MKKDEFLKSLQARLVECGLSEETAEKETAHVRTYLAESSMDEVDISIDEMADGILAMLEDNSESEHEDIDISPVPMVSEENDESVSDELSAAIAAIDAEPQQKEDSPEETEPEKEECPEHIAIPIVLDPEAEETVEEAPEAEETAEEAFETEEPVEEAPEAEEIADETPSEEPVADEITEPVSEEEPEQTESVEDSDGEQNETDPSLVDVPEDTVPQNDEDEDSGDDSDQPQSEDPPISGEEDADIEEYIPHKQKVKMKKTNNSKKSGGNEWLYVLLLVVTIPIAVALILAAFVLYLGFWVVLALAMIACIAALVVFVAVFSIIAIVGIVYGVVELITGNMPVGLFEIGLGVMIGAAVMFIGILIYNFAVRFIPYVMKLLARLFRAGFRAIRNGYQLLKGAVEEL